MYISMNWIKDYIDLDGLDELELINKFTLSTAEVEGITKFGENTNGVVIGKIESIENVEESKKLHIVKVNTGKEIVQSVCGAPNVACGQTVAFAPVGSNVCGIKVKNNILNGIQSNGVCLSLKELGIGDDHNGIMILSDDYALGTNIKEIIPIDDIVFEIDNKSLTNRPDLWGHYGIAREFAAITGRKLKPIETCDLSKYSNLPKVNISVESDKCLRYSSIAIENITKKISPIELQIRLFYTGLRSINLLADITNYIMLELGQPMHAFDKELVNNIVVKTLKQPTAFVTLDGVKRHIDTDTLMICDSVKPIAIAGIMGGENTEIRDNTCFLLLESATFDTVSIRKSTTKLGLRTDASTRYEKTLDPELATLAIKRYLYLLEKTDSNVKVVSSLTDVYFKKYDTIIISIDKNYISKHIGQDIDSDIIENILKSLCFETKRNNDKFEITVPSYRATKDVTSKADIVEEIARIYGYDKIIPKTTLNPLLPVKEDPSRIMEYNIKRMLAEKYGMSEVHSYIWYDSKLNNELNIFTHDNIKIVNSLNANDSTLRYSMIPTLLNMTNNNLKNFQECNIFEIGRVFNYTPNNTLVDEKKVLGLTLASTLKSEEVQLFELKKIINSICKTNKNITVDYVDNTTILDNWIHPVNSYVIKYNDVKLGYISVLHPVIKNNINKKVNILIAELDIETLSNITNIQRVYKKFTKYQTVDIDLSLITPNIMPYKNIEKLIESIELEFLLNYRLIDIYENIDKLQNKKSITIRFTLGSFDTTLTSEQINNSINKLINIFENNDIIIRK